VVEFPHFVELHEAHPELACASVSLDYFGKDHAPPQDLQDRVKKFLTSVKSTMQNFISSDRDEDVIGKFDVVAIPATLIYDQQGNLHKVFSNDNNEYGETGYNYADHITPVVVELLEKSK
jgi:hypothetical protein